VFGVLLTALEKPKDRFIHTRGDAGWCEPERILLVQIWVAMANIRMKNLASTSR